MEITRALVQTACSALKVFFDMVGLTTSAVKSEAMVFSIKHQKPDMTLCIDGISLPQAKEFKYLSVFFDSGLRWNTQVRYVDAKIEFHEIDSWKLVGGTSEMYATIIQGIGGINSGLCVCMLLWNG
jgi:hypothetical protein